jgi:hypothetical protein
MDVDAIRRFLERQTDVLVASIQTLLNAMREPGPYDSGFLAKVQSMSQIVDGVIEECQRGFSKTPLRTQSQKIINQLQRVNQDFMKTGRDLIAEKYQPSKALKQRMASCAYDIAKLVKDLINLL